MSTPHEKNGTFTFFFYFFLKSARLAMYILGYGSRLFCYYLPVTSPQSFILISTVMLHDTEPLTLSSWVVDVSPEETPDVPSKFHDAVAQLTNIWSQAIPGMNLFREHATWFKPETDLEKISAELGIPVVALKNFRVDKGCFGMSSFFTEVYTDPRFHVIEGLAIEPSLGPLALEHACLCRIEKGELFAFDLVRRRPLFMYGVVVRPAMKKRLNERCKDTWAGYSVINGLNYIKHESDFWD